MKDLYKTKELVKSILERDELARNSDSYLYLKVIRRIAERENINVDRMAVSYFLICMPTLPFPPFETVRRARQKLQNEYPWLAASEKVSGYRTENEQIYRDFATR